jgi:drug/metabolite transporter (DMT)-like permease
MYMHLIKSGIIFALLSLLFAGVNDVIFKRYSSKDRSRGMYVFGIGIIWTFLQIIVLNIQEISFSYDFVSISYGLTAGLLLTVSNILLLESLTNIDVSLGSTIYRLNTVGVVILSFFVLHEPLGSFKIVGIICGLIAVLLLFNKGKKTYQDINFTMFFLIAVAASLIRASYGIITKMGISSNAEPNIMLLLISLSWIIGGALYAKLRERRFKITREKIIYSIVSGILVFLIVNFLMLALEYGQASIVIPIANMSFIFALLISITLKMELLTFRKCFAVGFAVVSIILLAKV